uniref:Rab11 family-interacting protein 4-like n=1 Tax=Callorhinchus milii TaxID=7868 RepID=A0A4W3GUY8_CALMI
MPCVWLCRVHALEEQLKDQETRAEEHLQEEERRQRDLLTRVEREKSSEIEILSFRAQQLEEENYELKTTATRLRSHSDKLDEERQRMTYKLEDTSLRLKDEMNLYKKMMDKMRQNRLEFQKEREATQEVSPTLPISCVCVSMWLYIVCVWLCVCGGLCVCG